MNWASYILSFCLHVLIILLIWLWPASPPVKLDAPPVMISLVDGAPGGNRTPSSILGAAGQPTSGPRDFAAPAPKAEVAAPAATPPQAEPIKSPPKEAAQDRSPKDEVKEAPRPRPKPDDNAAALLAKKKKEEEAKRRQEERERQQAELKKKEEERKKAEQKKKEEARKKAEQKKKEEERKKAEQERKEKEKDSVAAALRDARRKASSRVESGDRGTAVEQALAQARKNAGGDGGGGGGGLNEVYLGQIMLAVRPNWSFASASRANFACIVHVSVDMNGEVQDAQVTQGSGNAQFDASAVNAVIRTGKAGCRDAVLTYIRLEGLNERNDRFGLQAGDESVIAAAQCVADFCRACEEAGESVLCFRTGGNEFALIRPEPHTDSGQLHRQFRAVVARYNRTCAPRARIIMTFGFSRLCDEDGKSRSISAWKAEADAHLKRNEAGLGGDAE